MGVGGEDDAAELERECVGVLVSGELVLFERGDDESPDQVGEAVLERGDLIFDGSGAGAHLEDGSGEEAAAGERPPCQVVEERVAHGDELCEPRSGRRVRVR